MNVDPSGHAWYNVLWDWVNIVAGLLNPISTITALGSIAVAAIAGRWSDVVDDWNNGCLNPFNQSESVVLNSKVLSFYKGETVVRHSVPNSSSLQIFGTIFLNSNLIYDSYGRMTLNHEWGHGVQERILVPAYLFTVAVPSLAYYRYDVKHNGTTRDYYSMPWERTADLLGGVNRGNYKKGSLVWGITENLLGPIVIPFYLLFGF